MGTDASTPCVLDQQSHHGDWQFPAIHAALRQHRWATVLGMRAFIRHADVHDLLKDGRHLREPGSDLMHASGIHDGPLYDWWNLIMFSNDGERHRRLRTLLNRAFAAHSIGSLRAAVAGIVDDLGDRLDERGEFDAVQDFAHWIPPRTVCHFLGLSESDVPIFERWSCDLGKVFSLTISPDTRAMLETSITALYDYVRRVIAERRRRPRDDLVSALIAAREGGDRLSEEELLSVIANIILGGHDTTKCGVAVTVYNLTHNAAPWGLVCRDPSHIEAAVEESMRRDPPVIFLMRVVTEPFSLDGATFEPGETIVICPLGANHDPARFPDSTRFDLTRDAQSAMTFGVGPHFCIGRAIARMEVHEAVRMLATRFPSLTCTEPEVRWTPLFEFRAPLRLRVGIRPH